MRNRIGIPGGAVIVAIAVLSLLVPGNLLAHHGAANYDMTKTESVKGTITQFDFTNPHSAIHLDVKDDKGNVEQWLVEADSPNNLGRAGWTRDSLKPGDQVTIFGNRIKDGSRTMRLQKIVFADGKELRPREGNNY